MTSICGCNMSSNYPDATELAGDVQRRAMMMICQGRVGAGFKQLSHLTHTHNCQFLHNLLIVESTYVKLSLFKKPVGSAEASVLSCRWLRPLSCKRQQMRSGSCLQEKMEDYYNCSALNVSTVIMHKQAQLHEQFLQMNCDLLVQA